MTAAIVPALRLRTEWRDELDPCTRNLFEDAADTIDELLEAAEKARVLIGARNDTLAEAQRQSNINEAWHILSAAISKATGAA